MATCAVLGRGLVEQHRSPAHFSCRLVTLAACDALVCPSKGEGRPLVIEAGRLPPVCVMTDVAGGDLGCGRKLPPVNILVAARAGERSVLKYNLRCRGRERSRVVALAAGNGPVGAGQNKTRGRMVESRNLIPGLYGVTRFAADAAAGVGHDRLPPVRVGVAGGAGEIS